MLGVSEGGAASLDSESIVRGGDRELIVVLAVLTEDAEGEGDFLTELWPRGMEFFSLCARNKDVKR